jgi:hypothetical protein
MGGPNAFRSMLNYLKGHELNILGNNVLDNGYLVRGLLPQSWIINWK